jgi:hypothetical protein
MLHPNAQIQLQTLITDNPGDDDAAILARCQADPRTNSAIPVAMLNPYLGNVGRLARIADTAAALAPSDPATSLGLRSFLLFLPGGKVIETNTPAVAAQVAAAFAAVVTDHGTSGGLRGLSSAEVADIIAMGDGFSLTGASPDDVAAARRATQILALAVAVYDRARAFLAGIGDGPVPTLADFKATL